MLAVALSGIVVVVLRGRQPPSVAITGGINVVAGWNRRMTPRIASIGCHNRIVYGWHYRYAAVKFQMALLIYWYCRAIRKVVPSTLALLPFTGTIISIVLNKTFEYNRYDDCCHYHQEVHSMHQ